MRSGAFAAALAPSPRSDASIIGPGSVSLPTGVEHPVQLYHYFMRYQPGQPAFGNIPTRCGKDREEVSASRA
ncbi:MAG TPA: hypothetical protein VGO02_06100 [Burkholderiales bacterium]|nr:hypothetical protein [Burkholderiales bacterium]